MSTRAKPGEKQASAASQRAPVWVPWVALGLVVAVLLLLAVSSASGQPAWAGAGRFFARLAGRAQPQPSGPLGLRIVHTNDTYGYVLPCG